MQYSIPFIKTNLGKITSWARDANSRDRDETLVRLETVSRPRRLDETTTLYNSLQSHYDTVDLLYFVVDFSGFIDEDRHSSHHYVFFGPNCVQRTVSHAAVMTSCYNQRRSLFVAICGICLSASFTQYSVTIIQVQGSLFDFNPESESESHFKPWSRSPTKIRTSHP